MIDRRLHERYLFFKEHAGYCTPPGKVACAMSLAKAEEWAYYQYLDFEWTDDPDPDLSWLNPGETVREVLICSAYYENQTGSIKRESERRYEVSLGGITDPSREYRRVIEAELASEVLERERETIRLADLAYARAMRASRK